MSKNMNKVIEQRNGRGYSYNFELSDEQFKQHGGLYEKAKISLYYDKGQAAKSDGGYERPAGYRIAIRPYSYTLRDAGVSYYSSLSFFVRKGSKFGPTILKNIKDQVDFKALATMYGDMDYVAISEALDDVEA